MPSSKPPRPARSETARYSSPTSSASSASAPAKPTNPLSSLAGALAAPIDAVHEDLADDGIVELLRQGQRARGRSHLVGIDPLGARTAVVGFHDERIMAPRGGDTGRPVLIDAR